MGSERSHLGNLDWPWWWNQFGLMVGHQDFRVFPTKSAMDSPLLSVDRKDWGLPPIFSFSEVRKENCWRMKIPKKHVMHSADVQSYHINQANHGGIYHMILNPKAACHAINACELLPLAQASTNLTWDRELFQKHPGWPWLTPNPCFWMFLI